MFRTAAHWLRQVDSTESSSYAFFPCLDQDGLKERCCCCCCVGVPLCGQAVVPVLVPFCCSSSVTTL